VSAKGPFNLLIGTASKAVLVAKSQVIFRQGSDADSVFYIEEGKVRLTVISKTGKEAIVGIFSAGDFFGEGALAGHVLRMESATAITYCRLLRVNTDAMKSALHREPKLSDLFLACLLARSIQYEQSFIDQLFNSSEKRLARVLLLLSKFDEDGTPETVIPNISQGALAEMVGTTRSRVNLFMNRFRTLGLIDYSKDGIQVHSSLLNVVLKD
jgi:CRP/FNR family cyclic AMP-dependent transcriptional regulator